MLTTIEPSLLKPIYFGPQGFKLFSTKEEQGEYQTQFSNEFGWNANWFVIGLDTELGDPYLIDNNSDSNQVHTAIFDGDKWCLISVADTVEAFMQCLSLLKNATKQTVEVYVPDENTLSDKAALNQLKDQLIAVSNDPEFWQQFMSCYIDWLEEE